MINMFTKIKIKLAFPKFLYSLFNRSNSNKFLFSILQSKLSNFRKIKLFKFKLRSHNLNNKFSIRLYHHYNPNILISLANLIITCLSQDSLINYRFKYNNLYKSISSIKFIIQIHNICQFILLNKTLIYHNQQQHFKTAIYQIIIMFIKFNNN